MKGVELGRAMRMSEVIAEVADVRADRVAVVSGPNLAREIAGSEPAATVVACVEGHRRRIAAACMTRYFRPYTNTDVVGCELGGAVKNVIAIAVGIATAWASATTPRPRSSPAGSPRSPGWARSWGRRPVTVRRPGRDRRPGRHVHVAAVEEPDVRGSHLGRGMTVRRGHRDDHQTAEGVASSHPVHELARRTRSRCRSFDAVVSGRQRRAHSGGRHRAHAPGAQARTVRVLQTRASCIPALSDGSICDTAVVSDAVSPRLRGR